jgi:hypothetical protein
MTLDVPRTAALLFALSSGGVGCQSTSDPSGEAADAAPADAGPTRPTDAAEDRDGDDVLAVPPIARPVWLAYFKVAGRYGDYTLDATRDAANAACIFASVGDFDLETQDPVALTQKAAADLDTLGAGIIIGAGTAEISAAASYWAQVVAVYATGEATASSPLDPQPCEAQSAAARATMASFGLANRPVLCYFDADISDDPSQVWHVPAGIDWIGLQAYLGPEAPPTTQDAIAQLRERIRGQMARLPVGMPAVVIAQAYDRNGAWTDIPMLAAMQPIYLEEAALDERIKGIFWFSYSRPGGTLTHEAELRPWHEAIFRANVEGRPAIEVPP